MKDKSIKQMIAEKEEARIEKQEAAKEFKKVELNVDRECFPYNVGRELTSKALMDQSAKADAGKPQLSLVPMDILTAIARVREYGNRKYGSSDNWKTVSKERYVDAMLRHAVAFVNNPKGVDSESGLPHLHHLACNVAFLIAMEKM